MHCAIAARTHMDRRARSCAVDVRGHDVARARLGRPAPWPSRIWTYYDGVLCYLLLTQLATMPRAPRTNARADTRGRYQQGQLASTSHDVKRWGTCLPCILLHSLLALVRSLERLSRYVKVVVVNKIRQPETLCHFMCTQEGGGWCRSWQSRATVCGN